ncbi:MAG: hypothetical protein U5L04_00105 [Trueperaceae bacterium]|nr:hypothetical protein [Trueperaceae bacterium]
MFRDEEKEKNLSPMFETLLNGTSTPPVYPLPDPPETLEEMRKQLQDIKRRRAKAMYVLSKL